MRLKVLVFTNSFPRPWEPMRATYNFQQASRLSQHCSVSVVVPIPLPDWLKAKRAGLDWLGQVGELKPHYFSFFYIPKVLRWTYGFTMLLSSLRCLPLFLGKNRPQIIYTPWVYPDGWVMVVLGRLLNIPVVIKSIGSDINEYPNLPGVKPLIAWVLKNVAATVAVSQDLASKIIKLGCPPQNTHVIYDGVDPSCFKPMSKASCRTTLGLDLNKPLIVYVGNILKSKGCLDLLDSFALLNQQQPEAHLAYVGKGEECTAKIKTNAAQLNITDKLILAGSQPHELIATWMGAADLIVLPSYNEGVPNVLLEAMASGRPIVATNVGGIPEVVPDFAGILVNPGDINAIAAALQKALNKQWDLEKILAHVSEFTWERNITELQTLLEAKANLETSAT